jgi:predicted component of type VI protein secretion system
MDFELHVVKGRSANQVLKLADVVNTVGRHDDCTIRIKSSQVSRRHCELFEKKGTLLLKDLGSANGTYVNGKKVQGQQVLEPGDELTIGGVKLRVARVGIAPPVKPVVTRSDDTAVAALAPAATDDEEFEIDFDDEPAAADAALNDDAIEIDIEDEFLPVDDDLAPLPAEPKPAPPAPAAPPADPRKAPAPGPKPAAAEASEFADEAVADFLLDIKLDDDD